MNVPILNYSFIYSTLVASRKNNSELGKDHLSRIIYPGKDSLSDLVLKTESISKGC